MDVAVRGDGVPLEWLDAVRDAVVFALHAEDAPEDVEVGVAMLSRSEMSELNLRYRAISGPTDVLSFPCESPDGPAPAGRDLALGDIAICPAVAEKNAAEADHTVRDELELLAVHGTLHLLGSEHGYETAAGAMEQREREILAAMHLHDDLGHG